jgi:hypothetical protein
MLAISKHGSDCQRESLKPTDLNPRKTGKRKHSWNNTSNGTHLHKGLRKEGSYHTRSKI